MNISRACIQILQQLAQLVNEIDGRDFNKPSEALSNSTIGQHLRHTLEFFICFENGYQKGLINYDKRSHDKLIETDKFVALLCINRTISFVNNLTANKSLRLEVGYDLDEEDFVTI